MRSVLQEMEDRLFAVIDTNVLVSALISKRPDSPPLLVMSQVYSGSIVPVFNDEIIAEYRAVLYRDIFNLSPDDIESALKVILDFGLDIEKHSISDGVFPDPKDIVFYGVMMSREETYLVTGNIRHFPKKPLVVTPKEMVEILARRFDKSRIGEE